MNTTAVQTHPVLFPGLPEPADLLQPEPGLCLRQLFEADRAVTVAMLSHHQKRSVIIQGLIEDNGFTSPFNRGNFYGYFENDVLKGVMLFGHEIILSILPEVETKAIASFAEIISASPTNTSFMMGPDHQIARLSEQLNAATQSSRRIRHYQFLFCHEAQGSGAAPVIELAAPTDLTAVAEANAAMLIEESGINPFDRDYEGFMQRTTRRIERNRIWVRKENGAVVFKAEIIVRTRYGAYLEGIWVHPHWRGSGIARQCLAELVSHLLQDHEFVCLLVETENHIAQKLYRNLGFEFLENYQVRHLTRNA